MPKREETTEVHIVRVFWRKGRNSSGLRQRVSGEEGESGGVLSQSLVRFVHPVGPFIVSRRDTLEIVKQRHFISINSQTWLLANLVK